jgi:uncharacterized UBP type Zn finger protein
MRQNYHSKLSFIFRFRMDSRFIFDPVMHASLSEMGFSANATIKAVIATKGRGEAEAAEWLVAHMCDEDFDDAYIAPQQSVKNVKVEHETIGKF